MSAIWKHALEGSAYLEALRAAALLGEDGLRLVGMRELSDTRGVSMEFVDEKLRTARVDVFVERSMRPRSLLMYVEVRQRGAKPNRFGALTPSGRLILGRNQCWAVEPRKDKVSFNLRACVVRPLMQAWSRMQKK